MLDDWNWHREIIVTDRENGSARIFLIDFNRVLFLRLLGKRDRSVLVPDGILRSNEIRAVRTQNLLEGRDIEGRRCLKEAVGSLFWRVEFFLFWLRRGGDIFFGR